MIFEFEKAYRLAVKLIAKIDELRCNACFWEALKSLLQGKGQVGVLKKLFIRAFLWLR